MFKLNLDSEEINSSVMQGYPKMLCLNSEIVLWSLNFQDEISLRRVECNIPLGIMGIHQSKVCQRTIFMEFKYGRECSYATSV